MADMRCDALQPNGNLYQRGHDSHLALLVYCTDLSSLYPMHPAFLYQGHPEEVYGCQFLGAEGGALQLATGSAQSVYLWDVETAMLLEEAGPPAVVKDVIGGGPL